MKKIRTLAVTLSWVFLLFLCLLFLRENKSAEVFHIVQERNVQELPKVALTFDDGPSRKYTPKILEGLRERGILATFFLTGKNIEGNEELVSRIQDEGHLIGNHTYNHVCLNQISKIMASS